MVKRIAFVALVLVLGLVADVAHARSRRGGCPGGNCGVSGHATAAAQQPANEQVAAKAPAQPAAPPATTSEVGAKPATESVAGTTISYRRFLRRR